ncbi:MAG: queuosine precursor transporter [Candidatus Izemoplasmatales bacterium]|nr:queuosine precursor transporter [Candidatus Izemoplasmatales bacterium]
MSNELLWVIFALVNFTLFLLVYKFFGRLGIFVWIVLATILANIQVTKLIFLFGLEANLGNIMYGTIFLGTDVLNEIYGKNQAKKAVFIGFAVMIITVIIMTIAINFNPHPEDWAQESLLTIFGFMPRILFASLSAFIVSQFVDVYAFDKIKRKLPENKFLWIRNNVSTIISQAIDTSIFVPIAFYGVVSNEILLGLMLSTYAIKVIVALLDTPFIYLAKKIKPIEE